LPKNKSEISLCEKMSTCLCVGPKNSGKTMLMTSIQYPGSVNFTTHSVNTVGTNIYTINFTPVANENRPTKKNQKRSINVRELGGEMAVMWKNYYAESVNKIIFVVDTSNLCQISCAGELLLSLSLLKCHHSPP
jgi:ADP-ribosylation factor-like protein 1